MCDLFASQMILSNKCNLCLQECKATKFGSSVIVCKKKRSWILLEEML